MVEGIDGSGKSAAISSIKELAVAKRQRVFDLRQYCEQHNTFPSEDDLEEYDILFTSEPSYSFVGKAIRTELIADENVYPAWTIACAFALDREILYKRIIIPALKLNKTIVQERGLASTMVYQPVQGGISLADIMRLPGNNLASENPPDILLILKVKPEEAISRLNSRFSQKQSLFDNLLFQRKIAERYESTWLRGYFEKLGSSVHRFDTSSPSTAEQNKRNAMRLFSELAGKTFKSKDTQMQL